MRENINIERFYRDIADNAELEKFQVRVEETDLLVMAERNLKKEVGEEVIKQRAAIKNYIKSHPEFYTSFSPLQAENSDEIIRLMCDSSKMTYTGPMASVAGAIAEITGRRIIPLTKQVFIENGGDIFAVMHRDFTVGIYAGSSPLSLKIGLRVKGGYTPSGIATSSGTVGHSFSCGKADAVTVLSGSAAFADGAATYFGNLITGENIEGRLIEEELKKFPFIDGILIIKGKELFAWGKIELVSL
ncbi:MAG: UPF0280 family protein [Candidatus Omnitrophica bacterium]|nr:UPF0280 family protein [Candidatus Omnitrophota bacterium]